MKQRIISAFIGLLILLVFILFFDTRLADFVILIVAMLAQTELSFATQENGKKINIGFDIILKLYVFFSMYAISIGDHTLFLTATSIAITLIFFYSIFIKNAPKLAQMSYQFVLTVIVCVSLSLFIAIKLAIGAENSLYYLLLTLGSAWWSDAGAYFAGTFFGKHKLIPHISPKKTVEGFIGGIITAIVGNILVAMLYVQIANSIAPFGYIDQKISINLLFVAIASPILSLVGAFGDICASQIKRQAGLKDFGTIMPGHGGVIDRFDSVLAISPLVFALYKYVHIISSI